MKFAVFFACLLLGCLLLGTDAQADDRLNILWLTCEDMSPRLGCYGDQTVPTPNLDRLASQSTRYTRAFTATGVCAPCRHTIITGLYPMQSGAQYMRTTSRSSALGETGDAELLRLARERPIYEATPPAGVRCFSEYLRSAGYYCTNNSKQDYQFKPPVTAWDASSRNAHYRNREKDQPFFAVFNATVTHESGVHGEQRRSPERTDPSTVAVPSFLPDTPGVRSDIARHYDNIRVLDDWVGKQLADLENAGLADSTIVFFYSDHGDGLPRYKRWVYDSGTHVPMLVRHPGGHGAGTTDDSLVSFIDLAPTALSLAGIERPDYLRGRVFTGPQSEPAPEHVFMHRDRIDDTSFDTIRAVRDTRYRYVRNYQPQRPYLQPLAYRNRAESMQEVLRLHDAGKLNGRQWQWTAGSKPIEELYDTQADPDETRNLAGDPDHLDKLQELRAALEAWVAEIDDPLDTDEIEVLKTRVWPPDGKQPTTAEPRIDIQPAGNGSYRVTVECSTKGASIGYRVGKGEAWNIYDGSFETSAGSLQVVSHRIGWKPQRKSVRLGQ